MTQNINLYDPSLRTRRDLLGLEPVLAMVVVAVVAVGAASAWSRAASARLEAVASVGATELQTLQAGVQAKATKASTTQPELALQAQVAQAQRTLLEHRSALQALASSPVDHEGGFAARLEALARQSVDGLWLTGMQLRQDDVVLKGRALQPHLIPVYVQRLDREPSLQGRSFKALEVLRPLDGPLRNAPSSSGSEATAAPRAAYVEFTLSGAGDAGPTAATTEDKP